MSDPRTELSYTVPRMSCSSCRALVTEELGELATVTGVEVDLDSKLVVVRGEDLDDAEIRSTLNEIGYEASA